MQRIVEPEIMDDLLQVQAYADADFSEPNANFVDLLIQNHGEHIQGQCLDLGCGPGDICYRMARQFPDLHITGVDGSRRMLESALQAAAWNEFSSRVTFEQHVLPSPNLSARQFDLITSNSLLHHLHDPQVLWQTISHSCKPGGAIQIMDLFRPQSAEHAKAIVDHYAVEEAEILKQDFYYSLLAAFTPDEVADQLKEANLNHLSIEVISDRHLLVHGTGQVAR
jgi:2-polyprenyl-3-methyl-5-hydroxy-6-metoxy-1,4-benzoquinol methylase